MKQSDLAHENTPLTLDEYGLDEYGLVVIRDPALQQLVSGGGCIPDPFPPPPPNPFQPRPPKQ